ncbi:MAG: hypothetical protein IJ563_09295 [Selenomonadaceae bacterium]|nr:hypothetical protein [Selenomonadaceae bacterium]MBR1858558.1 hypothetical protein [Selenomonadaceae bacterium]
MSTKLIDVNGLKTFKQKQDGFNANTFIKQDGYIDTETTLIKSDKLPSASDSVAGTVTIGDGLKISDDGKLTLNPEEAAEIVGVADDNIAKDDDINGLF